MVDRTKTLADQLQIGTTATYFHFKLPSTANLLKLKLGRLYAFQVR